MKIVFVLGVIPGSSHHMWLQLHAFPSSN